MSPWLLERDDGRCGKHRQILRHLNAARQIDAGTQARVLSELLGHRDSQSLSAYVRIATQPCARVLARYLRHDRPSHTLTRHVFVRMKSLAAGPAMNTKVTAESLAIGRRVLHRVPATAARRQRSHRPHLPRCTDVAVQVRRRSRGRGVASLPLSDLDADAVTRFLDHIELERSNSPATRNRRRAAIRGFFKHLLRNDLTHSLQYTRVLAIPARKKMRQRPCHLPRSAGQPPDHQQAGQTGAPRWLARLHAAAVPLQLRACVGEVAGMRWNDLHLVAPRQVRLRGQGQERAPAATVDGDCQRTAPS